MKICLKCKQTCDNDELLKCPKCNGELIPYNQEKYSYYLNNQKQQNSKHLSKEDRMYQDIHTIKNILIAILVIVVVVIIINIMAVFG